MAELVLLLEIVLLGLALGSSVVATHLGDVQGTVLSNGVKAFFGIPYAKAPIGPLRFRKPEPPEPWDETYQATEPKPGCIATMSLISNKVPFTSMDCLFLNVFLPPGHNTSEALPVLVFIHGGGFQVGSSTSKPFTPNPKHVVKRHNLIFVSLNYRLNAEGWIALPGITEIDGGSGNMGLWDQQLALDFVHRSIRQFGGDPNRVTLSGNSAGAFSICFQMALPQNRGFFQRAFLSSGICDYPFPTLEESYTIAETVSHAVGCQTDDAEVQLACLRNTDPNTLANAVPSKRGLLFYEGVTWFPTIDGTLVREHPFRAITQGRLGVDLEAILTGNTLDEGSLFVFMAFPLYFDRDSVEAMAVHTYGKETSDRMFALYDDKTLTPRQIVQRVLGDVFLCSTLRLLASIESASPHVRSFHYILHQELSFSRLKFLGAMHGTDMVYAFEQGLPHMTAHEQSMSLYFSDAMAAFVGSSLADIQEGLLLSERQWREFDAVEDIHIMTGSSDTDIDTDVHNNPWDHQVCALLDTLQDQKGNMVFLNTSGSREPLISYVMNVVVYRYIILALLRLYDRAGPYMTASIVFTITIVLFLCVRHVYRAVHPRRIKEHRD